MLLRYSLPLAAFVLTAGFIPRLADGEAERARPEWPEPAPSTFIDQWSEQLAHGRAAVSALDHAASKLEQARLAAFEYQRQPRDAAALDLAARDARESRYEAALATAERVLEIAQEPAVERRAHDIAAYAATRLEQHEDVLLHLGAGPETADPLSPYRDFWTSRAALAVGHPELARATALRAAEGAPRDVLVHEAAFVAAEAVLEIPGREREGVRELERLLARYPEYPRFDRIQLRMAEAEVRAGRRQNAADRLDTYIRTRSFHPRAVDAHRMLDELVANGARARQATFAERLAQGRSVRLARHWPTAGRLLESTLRDALAARQPRAFVNEVRFQLALNTYDSADFEAALSWLDEIAAAGNVGISSYDRHTWRARTLSRLDREEEAYSHLSDYYSQRSRREAHRSLYEFAADLGHWDRAVEHLGQLYDSERDWRTFDGAFAHYYADDLERAARLFAAVVERTSGRTRSRARYWYARTLVRLGRVDEAIAVYERVAANYPTRYYGLQSVNRMVEIRAAAEEVSAERPPPTGPGRLHWTGFGGEANATLRSVVGDEPGAVFTPYPPGLGGEGALEAFAETWGATFPAAIPAAALLDVGAVEPARLRFRDVVDEFLVLDKLFERGRRVSPSRPIRLDMPMGRHRIDNRPHEQGYWGIELTEQAYPVPSRSAARQAFGERHALIQDSRDELREQVRAVARETGDHHIVRWMVLEAGFAGDPLPSEGPASSAWQEAYPHAYGRFVQRSAERYDLNPYLLWALMIVESDMNPDTVSHADAYGLMQVIPKTGELVALRFGDVDFGVHDLIAPDAAMRFGAYYLSELLLKFRGQELLAMIAYNAGPHQVARWLQWRGEGLALDEFIETVPYDGARRYPQRILRYLAMYRVVHGLGSGMYVGNDLDAGFEDNIYF